MSQKIIQCNVKSADTLYIDSDGYFTFTFMPTYAINGLDGLSVGILDFMEATNLPVQVLV